MKQTHSVLFLVILGIFSVAAVFALIEKQYPTQLSSYPFATITPRAPQTLANPASVHCEKVGGTLSIKKNGAGNEYGLCEFEDNMACEEWALFRGDCPVGGRKTTGYDNIQQMYCAWLGGETLAVQNSQCTLPSGKICSTQDVYNEKCE